ncbi:hypothetical protein HELRODRAFT_64772, partial [Helobdella robusta]|uniref:Forkhead box protein O n=1 Tax=Helobdella robusta TaxID=6412 RepID=T1FXZ0_HELRO
RRNSVRRNAWGNASYAELITQAIESVPDKRLTLMQIYDWMIQNIPYFHERADGTNSMGWKNSVRHNLSLHDQFSRIQNEGTGKSSWWVVNKSMLKSRLPRTRRATMGDTALLDKKRLKA